MKRDMELVRTILQQVEAAPGWAPPSLRVDDHAPDEIMYHVFIMAEAGLLKLDPDTVAVDLDSRPTAKVERLTWKGHEFLAASREPTRWEKAKGIAAKMGGATLSVMGQILTKLMMGQVDTLAKEIGL